MAKTNTLEHVGRLRSLVTNTCKVGRRHGLLLGQAGGREQRPPGYSDVASDKVCLLLHRRERRASET